MASYQNDAFHTAGGVAANELGYKKVVLLAPNYARFVLPIMLDSYAVMGGTSWRQVLLGATVLPTLLTQAVVEEALLRTAR